MKRSIGARKGLPRSVLVTGGLGFIGSHLSTSLLMKGCEVKVFDDESTGRRGNLPLRVRGLQVRHGDILDGTELRTFAAGCEATVHLAGVLGIRTMTDSDSMRRVNVEGTKVVLDSCIHAGVSSFVLASSLAVYGGLPPGNAGLFREPRSEYGGSKLEAEGLCNEAAATGRISTMALRLANVYGPKMRLEGEASVMAEFAKSVTLGTPLRIFGDGRQTRDFIHVDDVISAILDVLAQPAPGFDALDIGTGKETSINGLADLFLESSGRALPVVHLPAAREARRSRAHTGRAAKLLGFRARVPLRKGVVDVIQWHESVQRSRADLPSRAEW